MKKLAIIASLLAFLVAGVLVSAWFYWQTTVPGDPWRAVPYDTPVIIQVNQQLEEKNTEYAYLDFLSQIPLLEKFRKQSELIQSFSGINIQDFVIGLQKIRVDAADFFFIAAIDKQDELLLQLKQEFEENGYRISRRQYRETTLFEAVLTDPAKRYSFALTDGLLIISQTPFLIDACIIQLRDKSPLTESAFARSLTLSNRKSPVTLYFQLDFFSTFNTIFFKSNYAHVFDDINFAGNYIVLDINFINEAILLNGYSFDGSGEKNFLSHLHTEAPDKMEVVETLPANTAAYFYFGIENFESYLADITLHDSVQPFRNYIANWAGKEWAFGIVEPLRPGFSNETFLFVESRDIDLALSSLEDLQLVLTESRENYVVTHRENKVYKLYCGNLLNHFFGLQMPEIYDPYFTFYRDYIIFGNHLSQLTALIDRLSAEQFLTKNIDFFQFSRNLSSYSNASFFFDMRRILPAINELSTSGFNAYLNQAKDYLSYFPKAGFQFNSFQDLFFITGYIPFDTTTTGIFANRIWQTALEAPVAGKPFVVLNHNNQDKEVFVQDQQHHIYLLNKAGEILWKRELGERIVGDVYQIDVYQNDRLQYLFTTPSRIFLIDRNGNTVTNFPIRLPAEAASGLTLVDYENDRNYRFFVACRNGNIYGYTREGRPLPGWSPNRIGENMNFPLRYVRSGGRDFLVTSNSKGDVFILNRRGENRRDPLKLDGTFNQAFVPFDNDGELEIYNANHEGVVIRLSESLAIDTLITESGLLSPGFAFIDIDDPLIVLTDSNRVDFFDLNGNLLNQHEFTEHVKPQPVVVQSGNTKAVTIVSANRQLVYAFSAEGYLLNDFPLPGRATPAIDFLLDNRNLVVILPGSQNFITAYRL